MYMYDSYDVWVKEIWCLDIFEIIKQNLFQENVRSQPHDWRKVQIFCQNCWLVSLLTIYNDFKSPSSTSDGNLTADVIFLYTISSKVKKLLFAEKKKWTKEARKCLKDTQNEVNKIRGKEEGNLQNFLHLDVYEAESCQQNRSTLSSAEVKSRSHYPRISTN